MEIAKNVFTFLIETAPKLDSETRCLGPFGEPDYPEEDYE